MANQSEIITQLNRLIPIICSADTFDNILTNFIRRKNLTLPEDQKLRKGSLLRDYYAAFPERPIKKGVSSESSSDQKSTLFLFRSFDPDAIRHILDVAAAHSHQYADDRGLRVTHKGNALVKVSQINGEYVDSYIYANLEGSNQRLAVTLRRPDGKIETEDVLAANWVQTIPSQNLSLSLDLSNGDTIQIQIL